MIRLLAASVAAVGGSVALSLIAKATLITALAIIGGWLARPQRAAVRHLIFAAAFLMLTLLPVAAAIVPVVPIPVQLLAQPVATSAVRTTSLDRTGDTVVTHGVRTESRASNRRWPQRFTVALLATVWLGGMFGCLMRVAFGLWQIHRLRRDGLPWAEAQTLTNDLARRAACRRPIEIVVHAEITGPMTCGVVRPAILFPPDAPKWNRADVRRALTHELEHIRRCDWITFCLARAICSVYWFHPLVWIANRQLCLDAERACDDAVVQDGPAIGYADQLVSLAERSLAERRRPLVAMASRHALSARVRAVLSMRQPRGPAGLRARIAVLVAAIVLVAALAPLRAVATVVGQAPGNPLTSARTTARRQFEVASIRPSSSGSVMQVRPLPDRLIADATLQLLMQYAYGVQPFQIAGGPDWRTTARYAIDAKADAAANSSQLFLMLQSLLEDRFQLKTRREMRVLPIFTLVPDGTGPKLPTPRPGVCAESAAEATVEWAGGRMAVPGELQPARGRCGSAIVALGTGGAYIRGGRIAMPELVRILSMVTGRTVRDGTGIDALFDVEIDFVPDDTTPAMPPPPPDAGISGESIAQAVQRQLGLRLESTRGPVEVIVIDSVDRPSPD